MKNNLRTLGISLLSITLSLFYFACVSTRPDNSNLSHSIRLPKGKPAQITQSSPPCLQMHYAIEKYAREYDVPLDYAYGIAYFETRYAGPFDWKYNHTKLSKVGAIGPMQIMPETARFIWTDPDIDQNRLSNDIDFNVKTSMKILRHLYDRYHNWKLVFGWYNTGKPCINEYAVSVYNHKPVFKFSN